MMEIYGRSGSSNAFKVFWIADELGLRYRRVETGGTHGGNDTPAYLAMNPNGKVPVLVDNGVALWESNAIVRYLAARHGAGSLWPEDPLVRADADRWMDWSLTFSRPILDARKAVAAGTPAGRALAPAEAGLAILDARLTGRAFVGGDTLGIADFPLGPWVHRYCAMEPESARFPALHAYRDRLMRRPAFTRHLEGL